MCQTWFLLFCFHSTMQHFVAFRMANSLTVKENYIFLEVPNSSIKTTSKQTKHSLSPETIPRTGVVAFFVAVLYMGTNLLFQIVCMDSICARRELYIASFFPLWYRARNFLWLWFFISLFKRQQTCWWVAIPLFFDILCQCSLSF